VADDAIKNLSAVPRFFTISFKTNSAIGERQILPWQTNITFINLLCLLIGAQFLSCFVNADYIKISRVCHHCFFNLFASFTFSLTAGFFASTGIFHPRPSWYAPGILTTPRFALIYPTDS